MIVPLRNIVNIRKAVSPKLACDGGGDGDSIREEKYPVVVLCLLEDHNARLLGVQGVVIAASNTWSRVELRRTDKKLSSISEDYRV